MRKEKNDDNDETLETSQRHTTLCTLYHAHHYYINITLSIEQWRQRQLRWRHNAQRKIVFWRMKIFFFSAVIREKKLIMKKWARVFVDTFRYFLRIAWKIVNSLKIEWNSLKEEYTLDRFVIDSSAQRILNIWYFNADRVTHERRDRHAIASPQWMCHCCLMNDMI